MKQSSWQLLASFLFLSITQAHAGVDVFRAILYPETYEESLCIYVVGGFAAAWIIMLTSAMTYWLWFRVPVPRYTYKLVAGTGDNERTSTTTDLGSPVVSGYPPVRSNERMRPTNPMRSSHEAISREKAGQLRANREASGVEGVEVEQETQIPSLGAAPDDAIKR
ncbi:hypothetical protein Q1695_008403 [Nippostrongylus brasiliensis]|nr:hypothetical protein Q1695_008403 [Nippostrongylus brasiliensis]